MKSAVFVSALAALGLLTSNAAAYETGVDVSALTSSSAFSCAKNYGYDHAIVRCYMEAYGNNPVSCKRNQFAYGWFNLTRACSFRVSRVERWTRTARPTMITPKQVVLPLSIFICSLVLVARPASPQLLKSMRLSNMLETTRWLLDACGSMLKSTQLPITGRRHPALNPVRIKCAHKGIRHLTCF